MLNKDSADSASSDSICLAHVSDIHFGRISDPSIVASLVGQINKADVDLVVVSGDLTQRAFPHQYRAATGMLAAFDAPSIVIPGNHDVYPWWRTYSRLFVPLRRYRNYISQNLTPSFTKPSLAVLSINSAFGRTIKGGRIDESQRQAMRTFFQAVPKDAFRILSVHHHLTQIQAIGNHDVAIGGAETLLCAAEM